MVYRGLYPYRQLVCVITLFPNIFSYCFWKESLTPSSSHLHNAARALSSPSRCFQLSTNLGEYFFRYLWYCDKREIECGLAWPGEIPLIWDELTDLFLSNLNAEIVACILLFRKSRHKRNLERGMAAFWACPCKLSWTLLSPARVQPL